MVQMLYTRTKTYSFQYLVRLPLLQCLSTVFYKNELKDRNDSSFIYAGLEAGSRSPTDVESWLNPACIKPSVLDYLPKPMVTSAIAQKWILSVVCFVCLCVSHVVHWTKKPKSQLHLPAELKTGFTGRKRTHHQRLLISNSLLTGNKNVECFFPDVFGSILPRQ